MLSKADTHIHTTYSDGKASPEELIDYVVERTDLRVIAITDHDTAEGAIAGREYALRHKAPLEVIVAQEVTTDEGDIVGLFLHKSLPAYHSARAAIDAIHAQGGLAIAVHPFSGWVTSGKMTGVGFRLRALPLDGVEVHNGYPTNLLSNLLAAWVNRRGRQVSELGGSDSHVPFTVGQGCTWFPGATAADLRQAILRRQTRAAGPFWTPRSIAAAIPMLWRRGMPSMEKNLVYGDELPRRPNAPASQPLQMGKLSREP
ncbi:MAG TPA: PHP-associated domain-containing protein [Caldilineaceae bacterium]|nr:PHP-associated domain-containing protein [Caldilineaceae bacterium]